MVSFPSKPPSPVAQPAPAPTMPPAPKPAMPPAPVAAPPVVQPLPKAPGSPAVSPGATLQPPAAQATPAGTGGSSQSGQQIAAESAAEAERQAAEVERRRQEERAANDAKQPLFEAPPVTDRPRQAAEIGPGKEEERYDFKAEDPNAKGPTDFVGFGRFAGLNDDVMRDIADRAASTADTARAGAAKLLDTAKAQATQNNMPMEKTPAYEEYLRTMSKIGTDVDAANATTNNPYEDALRGVYSKANTMRDNRMEANALTRASVAAGNDNLRRDIEARAKADAEKKAANDAAVKAEKDAAARMVADRDGRAQQMREAQIGLINSMPEPRRSQAMAAFLAKERAQSQAPTYTPGFYSPPK